MTSLLKNPIFKNETKAREWLEERVWPDGPVCPHCGNADQDKITELKGKAHRPGLYQCNEPECREQFTVTVGTVFERSKIPLTKWLAVLFLLTASKKGMSTHQIHRMIGVSYKSTWFMTHRLREAMKAKDPRALGGPQMVIEADETYFGETEQKPRSKKRRRGPATKRSVLGLVERGGKARTFHLEKANAETVREALFTNAYRTSHLHTDESTLYTALGEGFRSHETVKHSHNEYVRDGVHTNTIEGFFSIFKRGMKGVYQHCGEAHLHRYLAEFEFRYNTRTKLGYTDADRAELAAKGIVGKRLIYRRTGEAQV